MTDVGEWIVSVSRASLVSETDVRTHVAVPLLNLLGYPNENRAEEYPIFGYEGRRPLQAKPADIALFDSPEHHRHRSRESRGWVADHTLTVVELKRPSESLGDAQGQAQFYSHWAKAAFYATTNGEQLEVYRMQGLFDDVLELSCSVEEIPRNWAQIDAMLGYRNVLLYCAQNRIKAHEVPEAGYADYLRALYSELSEELELAMGRTVTEAEDGDRAPASLLLGFRGGARGAFPITLSGGAAGEHLQAAPYGRLLEGTESSVIVLSEPGGGKTYLAQMLARDLVVATQADPATSVPVILKARSWGREFSSVAEGVRKEVESFTPSVTASMVTEDLAAGRFFVIVDGLDEAPREGADLLRVELLRVAGRTRTRLIVTARKQDYGRELTERFDEFSIDPLTDEQIEDYASRELAGVPGAPTRTRFLYEIGERLSELVRNPLFLVMTVTVMKTRTDGRVPENRAELYGAYTHTLLTEWERLRMTGRPFEVDVAVKESVLAEYARATWGGPPDHRAFTQAVLRNRGLWDAERVRDELMRSGLLRPEAGGPEFFHPSFREYFFAVGVATVADEDLSHFVDENHSDGSLAEVFSFLVGLIEDERRQALVLDQLEAGNLYVFGRCLRTRAKFGTAAEREWLERLAERYLGQIRATHARLTRAHFSEVKHLLPPWRFLFLGGPAEAARYDVGIRGNMDADSAHLNYEFEVVEESTPPAGLVTLGLNEQRWPGERHYRDVSNYGRGLDSAREVAFEDLKKSIEKMLKAKKLPLGDNHPLGVEYVEEELRKLRNAVRWKWGVPDEFRDLSLRRSVEEVIRVVDRSLELYGGRVTFAKPRDPSVGGFIETPVDFLRIREYLGNLEESGLDPTLFMPPERDVTDEELERLSSGGSVLLDKLYSDEAVALHVGRFYDLQQSAYRWIAENLFPSFKDHLGFYQVGPVRHRALIFRNMQEGGPLDRRGEPSWVFVEWEPVATEAEAVTVCEVTHDLPGDEREEDVSERYERTERALRELGRSSRGASTSMWTHRSHVLVHHMGRMAVHDEVYGQLSKEIVKNLMEGRGGRLP